MIMPSRDDVSLVELDDRGVLFCEGQQRLYALDPLGTALWSSLAGGSGEAGSARLLIEEMSFSPREAEDYVSSSLSSWDRLGLLRKSGKVAKNPGSPSVKSSRGEGLQDDVFAFAGLRIGLRYCDPEAAAAVRDVFGHLKVEEETSDFTFDITPAGGKYRLVGPDGSDHVLADSAAVAVWLKTEILDAILRRSPGTFAIHAAALESPKGTVLLVGPSGCGKTTIAALLNAHGWPCIADDVVLIDSRPRQIRGLPLAYAVKPGSWPVIARARPSLDGLQRYQRPDAKTVKYLCPASIAAHGGALAAAILFPRFAEGASASLSPVSHVDALVAILGEARNTSQYLTTEAFLAMATIVRLAAVRELSFGRADEASAMLLRHDAF
jgi:hypothetical protein